MTRRAIEIGAAGEHIVCADLLLAGFRASLASPGAPYDVIAELPDRLVKVEVKSTQGPTARSGRNNSKVRYCFNFQRRQRRHGGRIDVCPYTEREVDLVALVALDIRRVAYLSFHDCPSLIWIEADTPFPRNPGTRREAFIRGFGELPLALALEAVR